MALKHYESGAKGPLGTPGAIRHGAPRLGEHNAELFGALGIPRKNIEALISQGIVCDDGHCPGAQGPQGEAE